VVAAGTQVVCVFGLLGQQLGGWGGGAVAAKKLLGAYAVIVWVLWHWGGQADPPKAPRGVLHGELLQVVRVRLLHRRERRLVPGQGPP
jgi:hypothetical protein